HLTRHKAFAIITTRIENNVLGTTARVTQPAIPSRILLILRLQRRITQILLTSAYCVLALHFQGNGARLKVGFDDPAGEGFCRLRLKGGSALTPPPPRSLCCRIGVTVAVTDQIQCFFVVAGIVNMAATCRLKRSALLFGAHASSPRKSATCWRLVL